jgi:hypothetical protein
MKKTDPPRFLRAASVNDEVRFAGVSSATQDDPVDDGFWLTQVGLWQSGDEWWGRYLRDHYRRGIVREFISTEGIDPAC